MLLIDDVVAHLQKIKGEHGNIEVCKVGHFGEINEMDEFDISMRRVYVKGKTERQAVVDVCIPYIGPEPD